MKYLAVLLCLLIPATPGVASAQKLTSPAAFTAQKPINDSTKLQAQRNAKKLIALIEPTDAEENNYYWVEPGDSAIKQDLAAEHGIRIKKIQALLKQPVDLEYLIDGLPALMHAIYSGSLPMVRLLVERGAKISEHYEAAYHQDALSMTWSRNHPHIREYLLQKGVIEALGDKGLTVYESLATALDIVNYMGSEKHYQKIDFAAAFSAAQRIDPGAIPVQVTRKSLVDKAIDAGALDAANYMVSHWEVDPHFYFLNEKYIKLLLESPPDIAKIWRDRVAKSARQNNNDINMIDFPYRLLSFEQAKKIQALLIDFYRQEINKPIDSLAFLYEDPSIPERVSAWNEQLLASEPLEWRNQLLPTRLQSYPRKVELLLRTSTASLEGVSPDVLLRIEPDRWPLLFARGLKPKGDLGESKRLHVLLEESTSGYEHSPDGRTRIDSLLAKLQAFVALGYNPRSVDEKGNTLLDVFASIAEDFSLREVRQKIHLWLLTQNLSWQDVIAKPHSAIHSLSIEKVRILAGEIDAPGLEKEKKLLLEYPELRRKQFAQLARRFAPFVPTTLGCRLPPQAEQLKKTVWKAVEKAMASDDSGPDGTYDTVDAMWVDLDGDAYCDISASIYRSAERIFYEAGTRFNREAGSGCGDGFEWAQVWLSSRAYKAYSFSEQIVASAKFNNAIHVLFPSREGGRCGLSRSAQWVKFDAAKLATINNNDAPEQEARASPLRYVNERLADEVDGETIPVCPPPKSWFLVKPAKLKKFTGGLFDDEAIFPAGCSYEGTLAHSPALKALDVLLNTLYQNLISKTCGLPPEGAQQLRKQQRDWLLKRDAAAFEVGFLGTKANTDYLIELTAARIAELERKLKDHRPKGSSCKSPRALTDVTPAAIAAYIRSHPLLVVQYTSPDSSCIYCVDGSYEVFEKVAVMHLADISFARVQWSPWDKFPVYVKQFDKGIPLHIAYKHGEVLDVFEGSINPSSRQAKFHTWLKQQFGAQP